MNEVDCLSRISLFSHLKKRDLKRIAKLSSRHVFHQGDEIIRQGDRDGRLFIILSGEVEVIRDLGSDRQHSFGTLGPSSYFGEMALIGDYRRSASVVAKTETQALCLDQLDLREEILKQPMLAIELLQMLNRRIQALEKSMMDAIGDSLPICSHCRKIRNEEGSWVPIEEYVEDHSESESVGSICPECAKTLPRGA
ncbi:MAG: cyclic nucleotide-binding domain-containing protein [Deltaproteobacteria bacterium]|nr:cyclic nucleotide-binding domain-containing protein [Deltaproteobacteria bacterium]